MGPGSALVKPGERCQPFCLPPLKYFTNRLDKSQNVTSTATDNLNQNVTASNLTHPPARNSLSAIFNNVMTLCAMLPLLIFTCLNSFLHQR